MRLESILLFNSSVVHRVLFLFIGQVSGEEGGVQVLRTRREAQGIW